MDVWIDHVTDRMAHRCQLLRKLARRKEVDAWLSELMRDDDREQLSAVPDEFYWKRCG